MRAPLLLAAALLGAAAPPPAAASNEIPEGIEWVDDFDEAMAKAAERGVPIVVSFANDD